MPNLGLLLALSIFLSTLSQLAANDLKGFDDSVIFSLNWPGKNDAPEENIDEETFITTHNNEKYRCTIPHVLDKEEQKRFDEANPGPTPAELLMPLFLMSSCSFRLESYWTYEVCHGRYIKQFHEERDGKMIKSQEYTLGTWNETLTDKMLKDYKEKEKVNDQTHIRHIKVEGAKLPAIEVEMVDGTFCDLNGEPRTAKVFYVCDANSKNEVYSLKESSTCNYDIIVLTPLLCTHPLYKPKQQVENPINCYPVENAANKPKALLKMEAERLKTKYQRAGDFKRSTSDRKAFAVLKVDPKDGVVKMEFFDSQKEVDAAMKGVPTAEDAKMTNLLKKKILPESLHADRQPVEDFLSGKNCLSGGSGWWKYELCYGRYVRQYHIDRNGEQSIVLGNFKIAEHINWLREHPHKRPRNKGRKKELSYLYTDGSFCEKSGKARQTEVKLRCLEKSSSLTSVSLFLVEPRTCEYELNVESPIICDILESADDNGIVLDLVDRSELLRADDVNGNE